MKIDMKDVAEKLGVSIESLQERMDGRIEWVCNHGCGHTVFAPKIKQDDGSYYENYLHGCDGCCKDMKRVKP